MSSLDVQIATGIPARKWYFLSHWNNDTMTLFAIVMDERIEGGIASLAGLSRLPPEAGAGTFDSIHVGTRCFHILIHISISPSRSPSSLRVRAETRRDS